MGTLDKFQTEAVNMWNRPGGKLKMGLFLAGAGLLFFLNSSWILEKVTDTNEALWGLTKGVFYLVGFGVAITAAWYLLFQSKLKYAFFGLLDLLVDNTIGLVVSYQPEVQVRKEVEEMFKDVERMESDVDDVAAQEEQNAAILEKNNLRMEKIEVEKQSISMLTPEQLQERDLTIEDVAYQISSLEREKSQLQDWNNQLQPIYNDIKAARLGLTQLAKYAKYEATTKKREVEIEISKYKSLSSASSAAKRFWAAINGRGEKAYMAEKAMMVMQERMAADKAKFRQVMRKSKDFVKSINLKEATYDKAALEYINSFKLKYEGNAITIPATNAGIVPQNQKTKNYNHLLD